MTRDEKDADLKRRQEQYAFGLLALMREVKAYAELVGVDLTDTVDTAGRHMGEEPYLKITAARLAEMTAHIERDLDGDAPDDPIELWPAELQEQASSGPNVPTFLSSMRSAIARDTAAFGGAGVVVPLRTYDPAAIQTFGPYRPDRGPA